MKQVGELVQEAIKTMENSATENFGAELIWRSGL